MLSVFISISRARWWLGVATAGLLALGPRLAPSTAEEAAAPERAAAAGKTAGQPRPSATTTLSFDRDPVQLAADAAEIWPLAFSANNAYLAASGGGGRNTTTAGQVRIWDFAKSQEVAAYPTPRGNLSVALSPDGRRVAWSSWSGDIWLREVGGAELVHTAFQRPARIALSPDGTLLVAAAEGRRLQMWDALSGKQLDGFRGTPFPYFWIAFSPNGKYLVGAGNPPNEPEKSQIAVWDVTTRQQVQKQSDNTQRVLFAAISPDSQTLAVSGGNSIVLSDLATGVRRSKTEETNSAVQRIEFAPDGSLVASTGGDANDGVVTLWDAATGKVVGTLSGPQRDVRALAFTHDGKTLVTGGGDRSIRMWNVASREQVGALQESRIQVDAKGEAAAILAVAYSPDGASVATACEDGQVNIYGLAPAGLLRSWPAHTDAAAALAYSPDGRTLVSGGYDKATKFWNPATGELIRSVGGHTGWVVSLAFSHDGQTLASGSYDRSIRLWNTADGRELRTLTGQTATIRSLAFSHDDKRLASGSADQTVRLWDMASGEQQATLTGHEAGVRSVAFSPDDRLLASGGEDQTIKLWNVESHDLHGTLTGHADMVSAVAFAQDTLVSTGWDHTIRTWDADRVAPLGSVSTGDSPVVAMALAPDGRRLFTANADRTVALWRSTISEGRPTTSLGQYRAFPWCAAYSPDGASLAVAAGGMAEETDLYLYDLATKAEKYRVTFPGSVRSIAFAPAGDVLALAFLRKQLLLVDAASGNQLASLEEQGEAVDGQAANLRSAEVAFSADGKMLATASLDNAIRIYDVERRTLAKTLSGHKDGVLSIAFSPDSTELISGSKDETATVWDLERPERLYTLPSQPGYVESVAWSPDGKTLGTACRTGICSLWNPEKGTLLRTFSAHNGGVGDMRFSPDGKLLATGGADRMVKLWDVATAELVRTYDCQSGKVLCLRFSPDGKSFVTTGRSGDARVWPVLPKEAK